MSTGEEGVVRGEPSSLTKHTGTCRQYSSALPEFPLSFFCSDLQTHNCLFISFGWGRALK